jgi:hypothetical protein
MSERSKEFLAKARELKDRAQVVTDQQARSSLLETAKRWLGLAREARHNEYDRPRATKSKSGTQGDK